MRTGAGSVTLRGRTIRHAYWKLGIPEFREAHSETGAMVTALQDRRLWVQNGLAGRFIGDNKLCLAVLSDPAFDSLFDVEDLALIRPHLPWSRNVALCGSDRLRAIRSDRSRYVLKRPLDTRGRGVVIGREIGNPEQWGRALDRAVSERWLVQRFCSTTRIDTDASGRRASLHHDLSLGVGEGRLVGALSRSSSELRTNVAVAGCLHPVFIEA